MALFLLECKVDDKTQDYVYFRTASDFTASFADGTILIESNGE